LSIFSLYLTLISDGIPQHHVLKQIKLPEGI
jgi:hypothetical protein